MSGEKSFFKDLKLSWFDRVLFLFIILTHFVALSDFVKERIETKRIDANFTLVVFIIILTLLWTLFIFNFTKTQVKIVQTENDKLIGERIPLEQSLLKEKQISGRYKGYIDAYSNIGKGFAIIHQLEREVTGIIPANGLNEDRITTLIEYFQNVCWHVADGFKSITGDPNISVSIKIIVGKEVKNSSLVKTFVRNTNNDKRSYGVGQSTPTIQANTAFSYISTQLSKGINGRYFFCNNLPQKKDYKHAGFTKFSQYPYNPALTDEQRDEQWQMPYRSTIVTGIFPNNKNFFALKHLIGFLSVDSPAIDVFDEAKDTVILTGVADGLYNSLKTFNSLTTLKTKQ